MVEPLHLQGDYLGIHIGYDKGDNFLGLVCVDRSSVLLHSAPAAFMEPPRSPPGRPWVFKIESHEPLLVGAQFHFASWGSVQIWLGYDHNHDEFLAMRLPQAGPTCVFRVPGAPHGRSSPWPYWHSEPLKSTAREKAEAVMHKARYGTGTGDPEMDRLLGGLS